ncbi:MAG: extracellular solute-binding protein [Chloroflexi bacterium]|nr:extracellular solute-binding protein [Chloroflexota bacterium]
MKTMLVIAVAIFGLVLAGCIPGEQPISVSTPGARTGPPSSSAAGPEQKWEKVLAEARKEGQVVVYSQWGPDTRNALLKGFKDRYGINVEWMAFSRGPEITARAQTEKGAGIINADFYGTGLTTILVTMKPQGLTGDIRPYLLLPEVLDPKAWRIGQVPVVDKAGMGFGMVATAQRYILRNTEMVKDDEIKTYKDLLKPQFKGKLTLNDPTVTGPGNAMFGHFAQDLWGEAETVQFEKDLLIKQEAVVVRDNRQQVEWVARGKYAIAIAPLVEVTQDFIRQGAPLSLVFTTEGVAVVSGAGGFGIPERPAHPNALTVFINWLLSKEGQTIFQKGFGNPSARADVPSEGLDPALFPRPGEKVYPESEEVIAVYRGKMMEVSKGVLESLKK